MRSTEQCSKVQFGVKRRKTKGNKDNYSSVKYNLSSFQHVRSFTLYVLVSIYSMTSKIRIETKNKNKNDGVGYFCSSKFNILNFGEEENL